MPMNMEIKAMTSENAELTFSNLLDAPPEDVYYAFSTAQGWRDWMCDSARLEPRSGGTYQLSWNSGWFAAGTVNTIERPTHIHLSWRGKEDPGYTKVFIQLEATPTGTRVEITHSGFGEGDLWDQIRKECEKGWQIGLENLVSIFSTGMDLRIVRRPMLGIFVSDFNEKIAKELRVPTSRGVRIDRPAEGMGAEKAGLKPSDVIVEMDGKSIEGFADFGVVMDGKHAGDIIPVTVYRGPEKITVQMELSGRAFEDYPLDPSYIAQRLSDSDQEIIQEFREFFKDVSEDDANFKPGPEEWSAKETLAHLITSEEFRLAYIDEVLADGQREFAGGNGDPLPRLRALLEVTPTIPELLDRLERSKREVVALLNKAEKLKARKGVLWGMALGYLQYPNVHERSHMEQMKNAISAARGE
jgi:uncharacterized protein YndB with AHSA1/START domain